MTGKHNGNTHHHKQGEEKMTALNTRDYTRDDVPGIVWRVSQHVDMDASNPLEDWSNVTALALPGDRDTFDHAIDAEYYVDGRDVGTGPRAARVLEIIERGEHELPTIARWLKVFHGVATVHIVSRDGYDGYVDADRNDAATAAGGYGDGLAWIPGPVAHDMWLGQPYDFPRAVVGEIDTMSAWIIGDVHGHVTERLELDTDGDPDESTAEEIGSCWGHYGDDGNVENDESGLWGAALDDIRADAVGILAERAALEAETADRVRKMNRDVLDAATAVRAAVRHWDTARADRNDHATQLAVMLASARYDALAAIVDKYEGTVPESDHAQAWKVREDARAYILQSGI